jgi:FkbM family methyltransferase
VFRNRFVKSITSNSVSQDGLYLLISELEYLQGTGAGAGVDTSGEEILLKILRGSDREKTIFDVGANVGEFTEMIDSNVDNTIIHLFEPQSGLAKELSDNYASDENKSVNGCALSDEESQTAIHYNEEGSGLASMSKRRLDHMGIEFDKEEVVKTETLDNYCKRNGVEEIDLLKIDVEGHELNVLKGAEEMLSSQSIECISFEFGGANIDSRTYLQDYFYFFDEYGYTIHRILPRGTLYELDSYSELDEKFRTTNFVAVKD